MNNSMQYAEKPSDTVAKDKRDAGLEIIHNLNLILGCDMNRQQLAISAELIGLGVDAESIAEGKAFVEYFFINNSVVNQCLHCIHDPCAKFSY